MSTQGQDCNPKNLSFGAQVLCLQVSAKVQGGHERSGGGLTSQKLKGSSPERCLPPPGIFVGGSYFEHKRPSSKKDLNWKSD